MFSRYAVFYTPEGALAEAGAAWLGWDIAAGRSVVQTTLDDIDLQKLTMRPRKYGLHGTLKPPFVLSEASNAGVLRHAVQTLAAAFEPVTLDGFELGMLGPSLALKPRGDQTALARLAQSVVTQLDAFRAPPSEAELAQRRQARLTPNQEQHLRDWGYPYVMDQFRFHITLTGRLQHAHEAAIAAAADTHFGSHLIEPLSINSLTLVGQGTDGMFYEIQRFRL
jgi:hypothetical protein